MEPGVAIYKVVNSKNVECSRYSKTQPKLIYLNLRPYIYSVNFKQIFNRFYLYNGVFNRCRPILSVFRSTLNFVKLHPHVSTIASLPQALCGFADFGYTNNSTYFPSLPREHGNPTSLNGDIISSSIFHYSHYANNSKKHEVLYRCFSLFNSINNLPRSKR